VDRVRVRRLWPGKVRIDVRECRPVARVEIAGRTYGLCEDLRIVPARGEADGTLPLVRAEGRRADPVALARALDYLRGLAEAGVEEPGRLEVTVAPGEPDRIRLGRGFAATVEGPVAPELAARNVAAFLETLDGTGAARGTLRVISESTAVWRAAA
jgi:hypothetical protein